MASSSYCDVVHATRPMAFTFQCIGDVFVSRIYVLQAIARDRDAFTAAFDARMEGRKDYIALALAEDLATDDVGSAFLSVRCGDRAIVHGAVLEEDVIGSRRLFRFDPVLHVSAPLTIEIRVDRPSIVDCAVVYFHDVHTLPLA